VLMRALSVPQAVDGKAIGNCAPRSVRAAAACLLQP